jgi:hypothetical protein
MDAREEKVKSKKKHKKEKEKGCGEELSHSKERSFKETSPRYSGFYSPRADSREFKLTSPRYSHSGALSEFKAIQLDAIKLYYEPVPMNDAVPVFKKLAKLRELAEKRKVLEEKNVML